MVDKRRRNARPSKYRPRTEAQKAKRRQLWEARAEERKSRSQSDAEVELKARLEALQTALRDQGQGGIHSRRHTRPLEDITDDTERFAVLKARVERLEALWALDRRKRETRGKILIGGALLAEVIDASAAGDRSVLTALLDILDRRVESTRDRLTVRDLLGDVPLPLRPGGNLDEPLEEALRRSDQAGPDFDLMAQSAMAEEPDLQPSDGDPDYADVEESWRAQA
jgi:hypothetical protein